MVLNKIGKPAIYLPCCMLAWGVVSGAAAGAQSYGGLLAVRFILGFVEAAYFVESPIPSRSVFPSNPRQPGSLYYLSCWYTRKELALRTALLYSGSLLSGAFGGLIAAGITNGMDGVCGLRAWRWLFIIEGAITV